MARGTLEDAVEMAASFIKDGMDPREAFYLASGTYGYSVSEIARAAGHRGGKAAGAAKRKASREREAEEAFDFIKRS